MNRPLCSQCNTNLALKQYTKDSTGKYVWLGKFKPRCFSCTRGYSRSKANNHNTIELRMAGCALCPFVPMHHCQMDIDHINGDHEDNRPENLQALCANCHRLKTLTNKDYIKTVRVI